MGEYLEGLTDAELYALNSELAFDLKDAQAVLGQIQAVLAKRRGEADPRALKEKIVNQVKGLKAIKPPTPRAPKA